MAKSKQLARMTKEEGHEGVVKVSVLGKDSIILGRNMHSYIWDDLLNNLAYSTTFVLITDSNLQRLHMKKYVETFNQAIEAKYGKTGDQGASTAGSGSVERPRLLTLVIKPGESSKNRSTKAELEDWMLKEGCTRDTVVMALGGGVIGDLVGFVAATFMRGVRFIQLPTSLLAMVDSSVGGKTAIDTDHGKNLIGSFWQPERVYMDMAVLTTLPEREFANGMAEVIKSAAIWSMEEFEVLERSRENIRRALKGGDKEGKSESEKEDQELLLRVVSSSVRMKAHVVTVDERESGLRGLLNFGHTLGHALEAIVTPYMLHGECVSIGCVLEAELSHRLGYMNANSVGRLAKCFKQYELPISYEEAYVSKMVPPQVLKRVTLENMMNTMKVDKKNVGNKKRVVLLSEIGDTVEEQASRVEDDVVREVLAKSVEVFGIESTEQLQKRQGVGKGGDEDSAVVIIPPGSKSISNRALILAALGKGKCKIHNMLHSDDTQVMLDALVAMGACKVSWEQEEAEDQQTEEVLVIEGGGGEGLVVPDREL
ncbi:Pentafunctional AROM polypeptide, partial [Zancudomyces culisetae]